MHWVKNAPPDQCTGRKMKFPICPVYIKFDILLTVHQFCRGWSQMPNVYDIGLYPLQDWWRTVIDFTYTGQLGNFIFHRDASSRLESFNSYGQGST